MRVLGVIAVIIGLIIACASPSLPEGYFIIICGLALFALGVMSGNKKKKKKDSIREAENLEKEKMKNMNCIWGDALPHITGLPLAEDTNCSVYYLPDKLIIEGGGTSFTLLLDRINDISVTSSEELQKSYVSSVGGAVGGAVLFGPLGAMVGGRAKERTSKIISYFLVFTYQKDDEIKYLAFNATKKLSHVKELKKLFIKDPKANREIAL